MDKPNLLWHGSTMDRVGKHEERVRLGDALRARRMAWHCSQQNVAYMTEFHRNYVGKVERGEQNITFDSLLRFADFFECRASDLLREAGL